MIRRTIDAGTRPAPIVSLLVIASLVALLFAGSASAETAEAGSDEDLGALAASEGPADAPEKAEPTASVDDVVDQLEAGSGVRVQTICTNCNQASLTINGVTGSDHVQVTFDGMPVVGGLGTVYLLTQYPSELVGYSHVIRGPGSVTSGAGGVGGTIDFHSVPRDRRRAFLQAEVGDVGWRQMKLAGGDKWGPVGALVFGQFALSNHWDANGDDTNEVAEFERFTAQGLFDFHLTEHQTLTLGASFYGENQWDGPGTPIYQSRVFLDEDAFFNWRQFSLSWERRTADGLRLWGAARHSRRGHLQWTARDLTSEEEYSVQIDDERSFFRFEADVPVATTGFVKAAIGYQPQRLRVQQLDDGAAPFRIIDSLDHSEAFIEYDRSVGGKVDVSVGARYDEFTVFGKSYRTRFQRPPVIFDEVDKVHYSFLLPRARLSYRATEKLVLAFAAGRGAVGPAPVYEKTCCGAAYKRSIFLLPETSWAYQASAEIHPTPSMRLTATLFWTDFKNYHQRVVHEAIGYQPRYANENIPEARVRGIDLIHDMRFASDRYNVGWTYTFSQPKDSGAPEGSATDGRAGEWLPYLSRHSASAYLRYDDTRRGTKVSLDVAYVGELRHYLLASFRAGPRTDLTTGKALEPWDYNNPSFFRKSQGYVTVNVRGEQRVGKKGWSVYAGVTNAGDYVQADLGEFERCYDWGPLQGRFVYGGAKFNL